MFPPVAYVETMSLYVLLPGVVKSKVYAAEDLLQLSLGHLARDM